jgi:hypothetical protein
MKTRLFSFPLISLVLLLAACSPAAPMEESLQTVIVTQEVAVEGETVEMPAEAAATPASYPAAAADLPGSPGQLASAPAASRMVIKNAEMELMVEEVDTAIERVNQLAADYGGYIISSQTWYEDELKYATLRLAVPSDTFEAALNHLRNVAQQVVNEVASGQDVTSEYVDLQSRLANLEATAARVREFLAQAQDVEEALQVNRQLSDLESQIEQVQGRMRYLKGRSAFSTVTVNLTPERPEPTPTPTPTPAPAWSPGATFGQASTVMAGILQASVDVIIWLVVVLGPFALLAGIIFWVVGRLTRSREPT